MLFHNGSLCIAAFRLKFAVNHRDTVTIRIQEFALITLLAECPPVVNFGTGIDRDNTVLSLHDNIRADIIVIMSLQVVTAFEGNAETDILRLARTQNPDLRFLYSVTAGQPDFRTGGIRNRYQMPVQVRQLHRSRWNIL